MPTMPSLLPVMRLPSMKVGDHPDQSPAGMTAAPATTRRATARIKAIVMSAVSSVRTPGVLVTMIFGDGPRRRRYCPRPCRSRDQLELRAGRVDQVRVDPVRHGRDEDLGLLEGFAQGRRAHRDVVDVEARLEQLAHAGLDAVGQLARHDDVRLPGHVSADPSSRGPPDLGEADPSMPGRCRDVAGNPTDFTPH